MLRAKPIEANDFFTCTLTGYFGRGCFCIGKKYKVVTVDRRVGMLTIQCEGEMTHSMPIRDFGVYFYVPIQIKRNIPNWL